MAKGVSLNLTQDEALVLFEWLARQDSADALLAEDPAEETVLRRLMGQLESLLTEPLLPDYRELLAAARRKVNEA